MNKMFLNVALEQVPFPMKLLSFPASEAFFMTAHGKSMEPIIKSGDILICQKRDNAKDGDIVICVNDSETIIIKKVGTHQGKTILYGLNNSDKKSFPIIASNDFIVLGIVKSTLSHI